jgi:dTDP-glucose 4,6-dehydratase
LETALHDSRHTLIRADIADAAAMAEIFVRQRPERVMHLAAESHVDR